MRHGFPAVGIGAGLTVAALAAASGMAMQSYLVEITGSAGAGFAGECIVETGDGEQRVPLEGAPPWRRELTGAGIRCTLVQTSPGGGLTLTVRRRDGAAGQTASVSGAGSIAAVALR